MRDLVTGPWTLRDLSERRVGMPANGLTVFSCFHCGGGSTMGYKLAGYSVLGGVEIDPEMMELYRRNFNPKLSYLMGVQEFKTRKDFPKELRNLDVLDGSPPCSSFSMAGSREDAWNTEKKFREGQAVQVLDDLFFHFIDIANLLRPKVVIAENVKGLLIGHARGYVKEIFQKFDEAGYDCQLFLLNASRMGVPQARERTFFVARRKDLRLPKIVLQFEEPTIPVGDAWKGLAPKQDGDALSERASFLWRKTMPGQSFSKANNGSWFNWIRLHMGKPSNTIPATCRLTHPNEPRMLSRDEAVRLQSFPDDYDFLDMDPLYVCGMSVPPLMMQRVSAAVAEQLLLKPSKPAVKAVVPDRAPRKARPVKSTPVP